MRASCIRGQILIPTIGFRVSPGIPLHRAVGAIVADVVCFQASPPRSAALVARPAAWLQRLEQKEPISAFQENYRKNTEANKS